MKISRFTDSQIMQILKQAEAGISAPELCREHEMSSATFYKWCAKYGGMDASMVARLKIKGPTSLISSHCITTIA
jgi:putative transposase|tara:strand:+ start:1517 stop:1741 length:225 start_codon:yes stop_codon:yes gene_type:complete